MLTINLEFKSPAQNVVADVLTVLRKVEIIALFITCFILGKLFWLTILHSYLVYFFFENDCLLVTMSYL